MPYAETASDNHKFRKEKIANTTKIIELEEDMTKISDLQEKLAMKKVETVKSELRKKSKPFRLS